MANTSFLSDAEDFLEIFDVLQDLGMPYSINWHSRTCWEAELVDANTRCFFPRPSKSTIKKLNSLSSFPLVKVSLIDFLLDPENYLRTFQSRILWIPLNLTTSLYNKIVSIVLEHKVEGGIFLPKINKIMAALGGSYCKRFDFDQKAFIRPSCPIKDSSEIFFSLVEPVPSKKATTLMEPTEQRKRSFEVLRKVQMRCDQITNMVNTKI